MSEVVLINSNLMKPAVAPIGLDYSAGALKARGLDVDIIDLCFAESPLNNNHCR